MASVLDGKSLQDLHRSEKSKHSSYQTIQTSEQQKWTAKMQGYDFQILYKPGKNNIVADARSHQDMADPPVIMVLSAPIPLTFKELKQFYSTIAGQDFIQSCTQNHPLPSLFYTRQGILFFPHQIFLPPINNLRERILREFHASPTAGHSGVKPTLSRIAASFYWPGWTRDAKKFIQQCHICQSNKYLPNKPHGLIQPLSTPNQVWEDLSMNFITHLPSSVGHTTISVICDRLTKYAHFIALPTHCTALSLAQRFSVQICRLHGMPRTIILDWDPIFVSTFWRALFKAQGTTLQFSSSYHPQTDDQTEVLNRGLEAYLRCFTGEHLHNWYKYLHLAELWYNTSHHSAIGFSPFQALYGRAPQQP